MVEWITPDVLPRYRAYAENEKRRKRKKMEKRQYQERKKENIHNISYSSVHLCIMKKEKNSTERK